MMIIIITIYNNNNNNNDNDNDNDNDNENDNDNDNNNNNYVCGEEGGGLYFQRFVYYFYWFSCDSIRYLFGRRERRLLFFNAT